MTERPIRDAQFASDARPHSPEISEEQLAELRDAEKQRRYEAEYRLQLRRRLCPGCGETDDITGL